MSATARAMEGAPDAYRAPEGAPLGRLVDNVIVVPAGAELPRICVRCGSRKKLKAYTLGFEGPGRVLLGLGVLGIFIALLGMLHRELRKNDPRAEPITYCMCKACERRGMDARHISTGLAFACGIGALVAAVAGSNGAPIVAAVIALCTVGGVWFVYQKLVVGKRFTANMRGDGIALGGIHPDAAQELLRARLPEDNH